MAREKQRDKLLPINPLSLLKAIGFAEEKSIKEFKLSLLVDITLDPELIAFAKEAFRPLTSNLSLSVIPYFDEHEKFTPGSELVVIMASEAPITGRLLIQALREQIPAAVVTLDPVLLQRIARENFNEIDLLSIVTVEDRKDKQARFQRLFEELGLWIARELTEGLLPLARSLAFVREPFVKNAIQATSLQNAAIGAVFFLPGSDMPLLTINQVKLFLQIAAVYNAEIDKQRLKELIVLVLGGIGLCTTARKLVKVMPMLRWFVRGSIAYTGTLAIGLAAQEYFEHGGDLKAVVGGIKPATLTRAVN